ncbi:AfsA-related hotdog domain-containing protein [Kitasatospora indigofera]|uniref:AfsA-related hotdog domain-containing protein n=1 Tax=Kitasatospora indigofera TaxID=67307 RepID=UPI0036A073D1
MSAQPRTVLLVGDRFAGFAVHEGVLTVSQFTEQLPLYAAAAAGRTQVLAGQGITAVRWQELREDAARHGLRERLDFRRPESALSPRGEAHKHQSQNTLIAGLRREQEGRFSADLRLHEDNELLLDHQTGQHVQGMVAVEAARQMFLAVSERYYASRHPGRSYYYVIDSMNTSFENFLFPLEATIEFLTLRAEVADPERLSFAADISVHQAGRRAALTSVTYTAFEPALIESKETRRARFAVDHTVSATAQVLLAA